MVVSRFLLSVSFCSCIYSCSQKPATEGAIRYNITYSGNMDTASVKLLPQRIHLNFKNNVIRLKMSGGLGDLKPTELINGIKGEITALNQFAVEAESRKLLKKDTSLVKTGKTETVTGYKCNMFYATNKNAKYSVWAAPDMPITINGTSRLEGFYLANYGGIPLKIIDREQDFTINFVADSVGIAPQPDSLFVTKK